MSKLNRLINEAFNGRRYQEGQVNFSSHSINDPHIQKIIDEIAQQTGKPKADIIKDIEDKVKEFDGVKAKAPLLYHTIAQNIVENELFNAYDESNSTIKAAPKFNRSIFFKLVRRIKADHDQFFPMRSFLNHKRLYNPVIILTPNPKYPHLNDVKTACATPRGEFAFYEPFLQKLIDWAHVKQIKPKSKKYVSNGGDIPDEYCYIEFVIIHEFMHYTYDDFHYQKMIKNANPQIINWVGDFRTNYLLVKSGYEQLPLGLFNDKINYDRQKTYKEMYDLVESEFKKLSKDQQAQVSSAMSEMSDDHNPGNRQGKTMSEGEDISEKEAQEKIDNQNKKINGQMKDSKDKGSEEAQRSDSKERQQPSNSDNRGSKGNTETGSIDYSKINPTFNWKQLIKKFISSADPETEETYRKPSSRAITGAFQAMQGRPGAMKPGEVPTNLAKSKLLFCVDSSGSMSWMIEEIYANISNLLKTNAPLQNAEMTLLRFSSGYEVFKGFWKKNKAGKVNSVLDNAKNYGESWDTVFKQHYGSVTNFTSEITAELAKALENKVNVMIFSDSDLTNGDNLIELVKLMKIKSKGQLFVIFDTRDTYIKFRTNAKFGNANVTFVKEKYE